MSNFTPGPWKVEDLYYERKDPVGPEDAFSDLYAINGFIIGQPSRMAVAEIPGCDEEDEANARLIAAAPDLYELGQLYLSSLWDEKHSYMSREQYDADPEVVHAREILAKAVPA